MPYNFNAISSDKEKLGKDTSASREKANAVFAGYVDVNELTKPGAIIQKNSEVNGIVNIRLDLINERKINNFDKISNITLKQSIRNVGLLEPIIVRTTDTEKFIVISGHRRLNAYKELVKDLKVEEATLKQENADSSKVSNEIKTFSSIPAIIFTVVEDDSERLGTNPKYITKQMEEEMYQAANMEARPISDVSMAKNIKYFYDQIKNHPEFKEKLLKERNKNAERKATKLNLPVVISDIITKDLKFSISTGYIQRLIKMLESANEYPAYYKIAMKRIDNKEGGINAIYKDYEMALKVFKNIQSEEKDIKQEYLDRMEKSDEPMVDIYNEVFNIKPEKKEIKNDKKVLLSKVEEILISIKNKNMTIDEAIKEIKKM